MRPLMLAVMLAAGAAIGFFGRPLVKRDVIERPSAVDLNDAAAILDAGNIVDPLSDVSPSPTPTPALNPAIVARDQARAAKLGADLMRKVGARFVGLDERDGLFFDTPKPFGDSLCRVNMYAVSENIRGTPDQDSWTDDLAIERRYAIWTSPSRPTGPTRMLVAPAPPIATSNIPSVRTIPSRWNAMPWSLMPC